MEGKGRPPRIRRRLLALTALGFVLSSPAARADTGQLTFADCITGDTDVAACTPTAAASSSGGNSLNPVYGVAVSPDGTSVYAISGPGSAVTHFRRDPAGGALTFVGCITSNSSLNECQEITGSASAGTNTPLSGLRSLALSADGRNLYTAGEGGSIATFTRDPVTGAPAYVSCTTSDTNVAACATIPGAVAGGANTALRTLRAVVVSPDGANVYTGSAGGDAVARFTRDPGSGALTFGDCLTSNTSVGACTPIAGAAAGGTNTALHRIYSVTVSPAGDSVYAAAYDGDAIARFDRAANGLLTYRDCLSGATAVTGCGSVPGATASGDNTNLSNVMSVAASADGRSVYAAAEDGGGLTHFERNPANGVLTQRACFTSKTTVAVCTALPGAAADPNNTVFEYPEQVAASADGNNVYVVSYSDTVSRFTRDPSTGTLAFRECLTSASDVSACTPTPGATVTGLNSPWQSAASIAVAPDGGNVYVGAEAAASVSRLNRELAPPLPSNDFGFGKLKRNKRKGTAKLTVEVPGPGTVALAGKSLKRTERTAAAAGAVKVPVKAKGKGAKKLRKRGKLKAKAAVTYTPTGGEANTKTKRVKLVRKR